MKKTKKMSKKLLSKKSKKDISGKRLEEKDLNRISGGGTGNLYEEVNIKPIRLDLA